MAVQVQLDQLCMHSCCIIGEGGLHWPYPTFRVLASDRPEEPLDAKSPTGAWNAALSRINAEIEARWAAHALHPISIPSEKCPDIVMWC